MSNSPEKALKLTERLRACAEDPMWANHAEVPKALCAAAANEIERLQAEVAETNDLNTQLTEQMEAQSDEVRRLQAERDALREVLKETEPVAWMGDGTFISHAVRQTARPMFAVRYPTPLYAAPQPTYAPLTDEQIDAEVHPVGMAPHSVLVGPDEIRRFARAIERAHGITREDGND